MAIDRARWSCAVFLVVGVSAGCSAPEKGMSQEPREVTGTSSQALAASNGLAQNGLSTNGLWTNGLWTNGLWTNGLWTNGLWTNGLWTNGLWTNGLWTNGLWTNGLWTNGLWTNGLWTNGLWTNGLWSNNFWQAGVPAGAAAPCTTADAGAAQGSPACTLQSTPYLRELLQYIYQCAMPAPVCPGGGQPISNYNATLDPNSPSIACTPSAAPCDVCPADGTNGGTMCLSQGTCDDGYVCSPVVAGGSQFKCVIPLNGAIGLGVNADGTTWWGTGVPTAGGALPGQCDESCQRWVSACVLARTNAYGVHVEISMRASAQVPPGVASGPGSQFAQIQAALATTPAEIAPCEAGADPTTCGYTLREGAYYGNIFETTPVNGPPPDGGGPAVGPVAETPTLNACAGPDSNIPEITRRFCSSQGDNVVINVPGVCVWPGTDAGAAEPGVCDGMDTTGSIYGCYTVSDGTGTRYDEVVTVYLATPIAVCGNAVCEPPAETTTNCPSDCHPGTWAEDITVVQTPADYTQAADNSFTFQTAAIAPDGTTVMVGSAMQEPTPYWEYTVNSFNFAGQTLAQSQGGVILEKYAADGTPDWGARFGSTAPPGGTPGSFASGVTVATSAPFNITVVGSTTESATGYPAIWFTTYPPDEPNGGTPIPLGTWTLPSAVPPAGAGAGWTIAPTNLFAIDSRGNFALGVAVTGTGTWSLGGFPLTGYNCGIVKFSAQGAVLWAKEVCGTGGPANGAFLESIAVDSSDNVVVLTASSAAWGLQKLSSSDGSVIWTGPSYGGTAPVPYTALTAAVDVNDNVYAGGYESQAQTWNGSPVPAYAPIIVKYDTDGVFQWANSANIVPPPAAPTYPAFGSPRSENIAFDPAGNVIFATYGDPVVGGGIDFGVGTFPTYSSANIFLSAYSPSGPNGGTLLWAKQIPLILQNSSLLGMAIDDTSRVVVSGVYSGSMQVDDALLVTAVPVVAGLFDPFLAAFAEPSATDTTAPIIGAGTDSTGAPIYTVPNNIVAQATSAAGAVVFFMPPTAIDNGTAADGGVAPPGTSVACAPPPNTTFQIGMTTVRCTASSSLGYRSSATFTVTVVDYGPVFSSVSVQPVPATSAGGAIVSYAPPTAVDQVDGMNPEVVTCSPPPGSMFAVGKTPVTCTAVDSASVQSQTTFTVTVTAPACTDTPPGFSAPAVTVGTSTSSGAVVSYTIAATDPCASTVAVSCTPSSGSTFPVGTTTVKCSASDPAGASSTTFAVTVPPPACVDTPPGFSAPVVSVGTSTSSGAVVSYTIAATDPCASTVSVTCTPSSGSTFPVGTTTVKCSASDPAGASSTTFAVTVPPPACVDTPPGFSAPVVTVGTLTASGAVATYSISATDPCASSVPVSCTPSSGSTFAVGTTTVKCSASDPAGTSSTSFAVTVVDTKVPTVTVPANITAQATSASGAVVTFTASATDPVYGSIPVTCSPASGSTFAVGTTTVKCTATDAAKNTATASFTVTVVETNTPTIGSFAVYATESIELNEGSSITGCNVGVENTGGPFLAGGAAAYLSTGAKIQSSHTLYASSVYLSTGASLGPIDTNKLMKSTEATYGTVSAFPSMPVPPAAPSAKAGTTAVTVSSGSRTLASGSYGSVTVSSGATLKLTGGNYVFSALTLNSGAMLSVSAATVVSVTGAASFSGGSSMGPASGSGLTAKALAVYFDSSSGITISSGAKVRALFVAPKALVTVSTTAFTGAITAAQVVMSEGATVTCEDGLGSL